MNDENFLTYLRKYKPYLLDIELEVEALREGKSGYGKVEVELVVERRAVTKRTFTFRSESTIYIKRQDNDLVV